MDPSKIMEAAEGTTLTTLQVNISSPGVLETNLPRDVEISVRNIISDIEAYRMYSPSPYCRIPLPAGKYFVVVRKRDGNKLSFIGDFVYYAKDERNRWRPTESKPWPVPENVYVKMSKISEKKKTFTTDQVFWAKQVVEPNWEVEIIEPVWSPFPFMST